MSPHINYYYTKVNGRCARVFRLNPRRFSVHRLRARFFNLFKFFKMLRFLYAEALESLKRCILRSSSKRGGNGGTSSRRRNLVVIKEERNLYRLSSFGRSNSFYSEAIADCLEFIKRSSLSVDDDKIASQR